MTDLERIKNEVIREWMNISWDKFEDMVMASQVSTIEFNAIINEAMQRYAELKCKEQIDICLENWAFATPTSEYDAIKYSDLATSKTNNNGNR